MVTATIPRSLLVAAASTAYSGVPSNEPLTDAGPQPPSATASSDDAQNDSLFLDIALPPCSLRS
jgi:hypothetical protein